MLVMCRTIPPDVRSGNALSCGGLVDLFLHGRTRGPDTDRAFLGPLSDVSGVPPLRQPGPGGHLSGMSGMSGFVVDAAVVGWRGVVRSSYSVSGAGRGSSPSLDSFTAVQPARAAFCSAVKAVIFMATAGEGWWPEHMAVAWVLTRDEEDLLRTAIVRTLDLSWRERPITVGDAPEPR